MGRGTESNDEPLQEMDGEEIFRYDLVLLNCDIVTEAGIVSGSIGINDGRVAALVSDGYLGRARETIDLSGRLVFPGIVDMHFHCRAPGNTEREDFDTATRAAAMGGVTTIAEMPISAHSPADAEILRTRMEYAAPLACVDYGFYGAGATCDIERARALAEAGALALKIFMHSAPKGREEEFRDLCVTDNCTLIRALAANKETGLLTCAHPEDGEFIHGIMSVAPSAVGDWRDHVATRVPEAEELAVLALGLAARAVGARVHACHLSSRGSVEALEYLIEKGVPITAETCPPYLFMDESEMDRYGAFAKVNPPLKTISDREALKKALRRGLISVVASDHAPFLPHEKAVQDFLIAPSGMPSVEFLGPIMLDACARGEFNYPLMAKAMSAQPARLLGLYPQKGAIAAGSDADLLVWNPRDSWSVDVRSLESRSRLSAVPLDGMTLQGRIEKVYVRGKLVMNDGKVIAQKGTGKLLLGKMAG
jgi:allantoinase